MAQKPVEHVGGDNLSIKDLQFSYANALPIFEGLDIEVTPGMINWLNCLRGPITTNKSDNMEETR